MFRSFCLMNYSHMFRRFFLASFVISLIFVISSLFLRPSFSVTLKTIKTRNLLKVCSEPGYLPFEMKDKRGNWDGFDYKVVLKFSKYLGVKLKMIDTRWDMLIPALKSQNCDLIASSMAQTKERKLVVLFSDPIYEDDFVFASKKNSSYSKRKTLSEIDQKGIKIAIKTGSSAHIYASENIKKATLKGYDADIDTVREVINGNVQYLIYNNLYVHAVNKSKVFKNSLDVQSLHYSEKIALAFNRNSNELKETFNKFYKSWKNTQDFKYLYNYFFKSMDWINDLSL